MLCWVLVLRVQCGWRCLHKDKMERVLNGNTGMKAYMDHCVKNTNDDCITNLAPTTLQ